VGVFAGPKAVTDGLVFALDARNAKTYGEIPGITDHGISDWYCFTTGTAIYSAIYSNTEIIEIDENGNETVLVTTGSDPQRGSITITAGKRYYGTKAIHLLDPGVNDAIAPVSFAGTYFGNLHTRSDPKTVKIYAPQDDINVSVYENVTGGVTGTATSTFSVSRGSSDTYVTTAGQNVWMIIKTDKPAIMTVGSGADDHVMMPMTNYVYRRRNHHERTINNTAPSNPSNTYVAYDTSLPLLTLEIGDGAGADSAQGIGYEYLSDTFSWGNVLSDYQIVAPYADTTVTVSYWANSQWNVGEVHSLSGTQTSPDAAFREGNTGFGSAGNTDNDSGQAANLASNANLWKWESTKPIALIINDNANDEENMLGWMSNKYLRTSSNVTQSFVNLIDKDDRSRMKIYGKDLTTTIEYAGAKLSADDYIEFDGTNDYVDCGNNSILDVGNNITVNVWFYVNTNSAYQAIAAKVLNDFSLGWEVANNSGTFRVTLRPSATQINLVAGSLSVGNWYMGTMTFDNTTARLYLNGVQTGSTTSGGPVTLNSTQSLTIGRRVQGQYYDGNIAQVSIYNRALTASEIKQNFNVLRGRFGI